MEKPKLKEASSFPRVTKVTDTMVGLSVLHCSVDKTTVTLERSQHVWADQHQSVVVHCGQRFIRTRPVAGLACNITWRVPKGGVQCPGSHTQQGPQTSHSSGSCSIFTLFSGLQEGRLDPDPGISQSSHPPPGCHHLM